MIDPPLPDPFARAPRVIVGAQTKPERLYPAPPSLQGALVGVICRDTRHLPMTPEQRLSHFPARELLSLSWFQDKTPMYFRVLHGVGSWQASASDVLLVGSQLQPNVSWSATTGRGGMAIFTADAVRDLFDIKPSDLNDQFLAARDILSKQWWPMLEALLSSENDAQVLKALEDHLAPRLRSIKQLNSVADSVRNQGRYWVERLGLHARRWRGELGERQVERKIKEISGRSLRQWQAIVKAEGAFNAASDLVEAGKPVDWAELALAQGFSDQAHFSRVTKATTGFSPSEVAQRYKEDESFWLYRLWV